MRSRWLVPAALVALASSAAAQDGTLAPDACDIDSVPGMLWHGRAPRMPLSRLAAYVAPVFWFSPDEPSLPGRRGDAIRIPEPFPAEGPADPPVVYYQFTKVLQRGDHAADLLDRSNAADPVLNLERAAGFELSFYAYFRDELGLGAHTHDIGPAEFRVVLLRGDDDERLERRGCTSADRILYVTRSTGKAHGLVWFWNVRETDAYTKFPMNLLVDEGKLDDLSPGRHSIEVAARDAHSGWSARPAELVVEVRGRWWQSLAFRLLALAVAALGAATLARVRIREAEARARELRREITRREHAEAEAQARLHHLAHISRVALAGELATSLAHELNQPLAAIVSNADAARRMLTVAGAGPGGEDIDDVLRDISTEGKRASGMIRTLREFLRRGAREFVPVDVTSTIAEVLPVLRHLLDRHQVTVVVLGTTDLPPVLGDRVALQQVLMNLIVNAVEAMQATPPELRLIEIEGRGAQSCLTLPVAPRG